MENVLDLYAQEPAFDRARVCFDERPCQLLGDVIAPLPMKAGKPEKQDLEAGYLKLCSSVLLMLRLCTILSVYTAIDDG